MSRRNTLKTTMLSNGVRDTTLSPFNAGTLNFLSKQLTEISEELKDPENLNAASEVIAKDMRKRIIDIASKNGVYQQSQDGQQIDTVRVEKTASGRSTVRIHSGQGAVSPVAKKMGVHTDWSDAYYIEYGYGPLAEGTDVPGKPSGYEVNVTDHEHPWSYLDRHTRQHAKSFGMAPIAPGYRGKKETQAQLRDPKSKLRQDIVSTVLKRAGKK